MRLCVRVARYTFFFHLRSGTTIKSTDTFELWEILTRTVFHFIGQKSRFILFHDLFTVKAKNLRSRKTTTSNDRADL